MELQNVDQIANGAPLMHVDAENNIAAQLANSGVNGDPVVFWGFFGVCLKL